MYFGLPRYIPPRPLGETRVRKHWSTKYIFINTLLYDVFTYTILPSLPLLGEGFYTRKQRFICYIS
jgi:hypothetical protein